jgi:hypothetical protein
MYILALLLAGGFVCNLLIRPVAERWFTKSEAAHDRAILQGVTMAPPQAGIGLVLGWLAVGLPLAWGFYMTIAKAAALFS